MEEEGEGRQGARGGKQVATQEAEEGSALRVNAEREEWGDNDTLRNPVSPLADSNISFRPLPRPPVPEP